MSAELNQFTITAPRRTFRFRAAGEQIGAWTLVRHLGHGRWDCRCVCGTMRRTQPASLVRDGNGGCINCDRTLRRWLAKPLSDDIAPRNPDRIRLSEIIEEVAGHFGLHKSAIYATARLRPCAWPRQLVFLLARELTTHSLPDLGRRIGGRDHSTVLFGVRRAKERIENDPEWAEHYRAIKYQLEFGRAANSNEAAP